MTLRVLDLFSGIGGFSLGLERTGGFKTVAFCEIEPFCRRVLEKHWPDVPIYSDVRRLNGTDVGPIDLICGGPPCQPNSSAAHGRIKGQEDHRFLWWEACRLVRELGPTWFIFENVAHFDRVGLEPVVSYLETLGYEIGAPLEIPACAVGHDHWRARLWLCGYADRYSQSRRSFHEEASWLSGNRLIPGNSREAHGFSRGLDTHRRRALGNAVVPQIPEIIGRAILEAEGRRK